MLQKKQSMKQKRENKIKTQFYFFYSSPENDIVMGGLSFYRIPVFQLRHQSTFFDFL